MKNQITFYIPTLNSEKTVKDCLESIVSLGNYKIVVIDGESFDNTIRLVKKVKVKLFAERSKHLANARNIALKNCKTKYIAFIDSDCVVNKNWLSNIMKNFSKNVVGVCGRLEEKYTISLADKWRTFHLKQHWGNNKIKNPDFLFGSNSIFNTNALRKVGGFDEKYKTNFEDVDMSKRLKEKGFDIIYEPKAECFHLRKNSIVSVIKAARSWSFYSFQTPDNFVNLVKRIIFFNPFLFFSYIIKDIFKLKFFLIFVTFLTFSYNQYYDIDYYLNFNKKSL